MGTSATASAKGLRHRKKMAGGRRMTLLKRAGLFSNDMQGAEITRATTLAGFVGAYRMVHDIFVRQGYIHPNESGIRVRSFEALPETATFIAKADNEVVGVTSVIVDSSDLGLPSDESFKVELDELRAQGRKICEGTNWLVTDSHRNSAVMTELMRCCFAHALKIGCTDFIGTVSPGHAKFYGLLGFEQVSDVRSYSSEIKDPVVVVRLDISGLDERFRNVTKADDNVESFLKSYYINDNPYHRYVGTWQIMSDRFFSDPMLLTELFVHRNGLLERCSRSELEAIRGQWGEELFEKVIANVPVSA